MIFSPLPAIKTLYLPSVDSLKKIKNERGLDKIVSTRAGLL
jgi:hypothetical protein